MSETIKVELIDPNAVPPGQEELSKAADEEMAEFQKFFETGLKQTPPTPLEKTYLKTYLMFKLLGPDMMIRMAK